MNSDKKAEKCPMEFAMELISRKWVIQILRDMFFGKKCFNEFKEGKPNISIFKILYLDEFKIKI